MYSFFIKNHINKAAIWEGVNTYFDGAYSIDWVDNATPSNKDVLLECVLMEGDVSIDLHIYTKIYIDYLALAIFCTKYWNVDIIISDEDINPFAWILIDKNGNQGKVSQIPTDNEEFRIEKL
ncbi:hypothetical protein [Chitinophaga sp.]|uniref:hypothetical protein n=1 Tax=Chitinophaga sp. TaxID=1869181 RepID=UPI0025C2A684|nr:hypothetical protein [Chitinophaga sp.]